MRHLLLILSLATAPVSVAAQDADGRSLMEQGMQQFFEGLMQEVEPRLRDLRRLAEDLEPALRSFVEEMGPALEDLMGDVQDWSAYHPPEVLPNGDIILRKKTPEERALPERDAGSEIEI